MNDTMEVSCDVLILGGGPAGSAAALELIRSGHSVTMLERSNYKGQRIGETLPPESRQLLEAMSVWDAFQHDGHRPSPGIVSSWSTSEPYENDFIFNPYGHGWHLDRTRFDGMLAESAEARGVRLLRNSQVRRCQQLDDGNWLLTGQRCGEPFAVRGRVAVDTTGHAAWLAQRNGAKRIVLDQLVAVIGVGAQSESGDSRTIVESVSDGWWYAARLPGKQTVAAYMTDADLLPRGHTSVVQHWRERLRQSPLTMSAITDTATVQDVRVVCAHTARLDRLVGPGWISAGDAVASYDPLSSRGISKALESGMRAAQAVEAWFAERSFATADYAAWIDEDFENYRRQHQHYYAQVTRYSQSPFWQRRQNASELSTQRQHATRSQLRV
jgi:flavin-dependent dehydrogenase